MGFSKRLRRTYSLSLRHVEARHFFSIFAYSWGVKRSPMMRVLFAFSFSITFLFHVIKHCISLSSAKPANSEQKGLENRLLNNRTSCRLQELCNLSAFPLRCKTWERF